jgi:hypothetical protein
MASEREQAIPLAYVSARQQLDRLIIPKMLRELLDLAASSELDAHLGLGGFYAVRIHHRRRRRRDYRRGRLNRVGGLLSVVRDMLGPGGAVVVAKLVPASGVGVPVGSVLLAHGVTVSFGKALAGPRRPGSACPARFACIPLVGA